MKIRIAFCESWYKTKQGVQWYKAHFQLTQDMTAWVPVNKNLPAGTEITLRLSKDFDSGRVKVTAVI